MTGTNWVILGYPEQGNVENKTVGAESRTPALKNMLGPYISWSAECSIVQILWGSSCTDKGHDQSVSEPKWTTIWTLNPGWHCCSNAIPLLYEQHHTTSRHGLTVDTVGQQPLPQSVVWVKEKCLVGAFYSMSTGLNYKPKLGMKTYQQHSAISAN